MTFVFYDTETTGTSTSFDQILQFAAIRTDSELNEIERFDIRSRLLPHVVPAPGAMRMTGIMVAQLTDPSLPSHYEMVRAIRDRLLSWSPALFIGYNSHRFDEHLLRQAFYQTLHPPYLTNTNNNSRSDAMRMVQAVSLFAPNALTTPIDDSGRAVFKLELVAPANGFDHSNAHEALADVEATIHLCRILKDRAPDVWSAFMRFSQKAAVIDYLVSETIFSLSDFYFSRPYSWLVTAIGANAANSSEHYVYDLGVDPASLSRLSDEQLASRLCRSPKPVRRVKCNGSPILMLADEAPKIAVSRDLGPEELERRAGDLRSDAELCARLITSFESTQEVREPSVHVEEQIYDGFPSPADHQRMEMFHHLSWENRPALVEQFEDRRLKQLARRLIHIERPDLLDDASRCEHDLAVARRVAGRDDSAPWLALPKAIQEVDDLLSTAGADDGVFLRSHREFLVQRMEEALELLG